MPDQNQNDIADVRSLMAPPRQVSMAMPFMPVQAAQPAMTPMLSNPFDTNRQVGTMSVDSKGVTTINAGTVQVQGLVDTHRGGEGGSANTGVSTAILDQLRSIYMVLAQPPPSPVEQLQNKLMNNMYPGVMNEARGGRLSVGSLMTSQPNTQFTQGYSPDEVTELAKLMTVNNFNGGGVAMQDPRSSGRITAQKAAYVGQMLQVMSTGQSAFGTRDPSEQIELMNQLHMGNNTVDGSIYNTRPATLQNRMMSMVAMGRQYNAEPESIVSGLLQSTRYIDATSGRLTDPITGKRESGGSFGSAMRIEQAVRDMGKKYGRTDSSFMSRSRDMLLDLNSRFTNSQSSHNAALLEYAHDQGWLNKDAYKTGRGLSDSGKAGAPLRNFLQEQLKYTGKDVDRAGIAAYNLLSPDAREGVDSRVATAQQSADLNKLEAAKTQTNREADWARKMQRNSALPSYREAMNTPEMKLAKDRAIVNAIRQQITDNSNIQGYTKSNMFEYITAQRKKGVSGEELLRQIDNNENGMGPAGDRTTIEKMALTDVHDTLYDVNKLSSPEMSAGKKLRKSGEKWGQAYERATSWNVGNILPMTAEERRTGTNWTDDIKEAANFVWGGALTVTPLAALRLIPAINRHANASLLRGVSVMNKEYRAGQNVDDRANALTQTLLQHQEDISDEDRQTLQAQQDTFDTGKILSKEDAKKAWKVADDIWAKTYTEDKVGAKVIQTEFETRANALNLEKGMGEGTSNTFLFDLFGGSEGAAPLEFKDRMALADKLDTTPAALQYVAQRGINARDQNVVQSAIAYGLGTEGRTGDVRAAGGGPMTLTGRLEIISGDQRHLANLVEGRGSY